MNWATEETYFISVTIFHVLTCVITLCENLISSNYVLGCYDHPGIRWNESSLNIFNLGYG